MNASNNEYWVRAGLGLSGLAGRLSGLQMFDTQAGFGCTRPLGGASRGVLRSNIVEMERLNFLKYYYGH